MNRLILGLVLVFSLAQFNYLGAQEEQIEQFYSGPITDIPALVTSTQGKVVALGVSLADSSWKPMDVIEYGSGPITVYMQITVINFASSTTLCKVEYDLRYADGASYYVYRTSKSVKALSKLIVRIPVSSYVAKLGLFTLTGRVYGTGMGNDNKVTAQAYVFSND
jgi:hypothetical protein